MLKSHFMISPHLQCSASLIVWPHMRSKQTIKRGLKDIFITNCSPKHLPVILTAMESFQLISLLFRDRFTQTGGAGDESVSHERSHSCKLYISLTSSWWKCQSNK